YAEEGNRLLNRMPRLEAHRSIRREYQKLVDGEGTVEGFEKQRNLILEQTRLSHNAAMDYGDKVYKAIETVVDNYIKEVNPGDLAASAVKGIYYQVEEKVPADISEKLTRSHEFQKDDMILVLAEARERLGNREDLGNHKDIDITLQRMLLK